MSRGSPRPPFVEAVRDVGRRLLDRTRWEPIHEELAVHPVFRSCSRPEIRRVVRSGDEVGVAAGEVILHEDHIGYWFVVVLDGAATAAVAGRVIGELTAPAAAGAVAILGFAPQPATVTATTPVRAFVLGRREFLTLVEMPSVQRGLFPSLDGDGFRAHVRQLRDDATTAWRAMPPERRPIPPGTLRAARGDDGLIARETLPASFHVYRRRGAPPTLPRPFPPPAPAEIAVAAAPGSRLTVTRRSVVATIAALVLAVAVFSVRYHPPVAIATPSAPIDIGADITVTGAPTYPISGRYLLLAVDFHRPSLAGLGLAKLRHQTTVAAPDEDEGGAASAAAARQAFVDSRRRAVDTALRAMGLDPGRVRVDVADHDLVGPSAGLVYALAIGDLLTPDDWARGRTVAASGAIDDTGRVGPVWFVADKARGARGHGVDVLLVPTGEEPAAVGARPARRRPPMVIVGVASVDAARRALVAQ